MKRSAEELERELEEQQEINVALFEQIKIELAINEVSLTTMTSDANVAQGLKSTVIKIVSEEQLSLGVNINPAETAEQSKARVIEFLKVSIERLRSDIRIFEGFNNGTREVENLFGSEGESEEDQVVPIQKEDEELLTRERDQEVPDPNLDLSVGGFVIKFSKRRNLSER
jgi:hypothetical protein